MKNIIKAEFFKLNKRYIFLFLLAFNCISILYSLGVYFGWSWVSFEGVYDLITYVTAMWQLLFLIGVPLILFMYLGASIIGTERIQGQLTLEVTRVANNTKLITGKFISMLLVVLIYFFINIIISSLCYIFILSKTEFAAESMIICDEYTLELVINCVAVVFFLVISVFLAMFVSIKKSAIFATISGVIVYAILSLGSRILGLGKWVPGYLALNASADFNRGTILYQMTISITLMIIFLYASIKKFSKIDL